MGIKNFHPVIKRNAPRAYSEYTFEELAGKWVGIDVSIFIYRYMCVDGEGWMNGIAYLFEALRSNGIKFVTIFDGKAPPEKEAEHLKRRGAQDKLKQKAVDLLWLVEHLDELGMDSRVCDTTEEFERTTRLGMKESDLGKINIDRKLLRAELRKVEKQCVVIHKKDYETLKTFGRHVGITSIQAPGEAEAFGAYLVVHGLLDAILTEDTDVLAYGCEMFLHKIQVSSKKVSCVHHSKLCAGLEFTPEQVTDLAILCGNDYNTNLPKVGPVTAVSLLSEYGSIEELLKETGKDGTILNYVRSRELFSIPRLDVIEAELESQGIETPFIVGSVDHMELPLFILTNNMRISHDKLRKAWRAGRKINAAAVEIVFKD